MVQAPVKPAPEAKRELAGIAAVAGAPPITLRLPPQWALDGQRLLELSALNEALWFERSAEGALQISPPPSFYSSRSAGLIFGQILNWQLDGDDGESLPADGGYELADSGVLVPDASWVSSERLAGNEPDATDILHLAPDFVLEVLSPSQSIRDQQEKMERWMANGVRLGWLIDPYDALVWIYREGQEEPELLERPDTLSGEDVMVGLVVELTRLWRANKGRDD